MINLYECLRQNEKEAIEILKRLPAQHIDFTECTDWVEKPVIIMDGVGVSVDEVAMEDEKLIVCVDNHWHNLNEAEGLTANDVFETIRTYAEVLVGHITEAFKD